MSGPGRTICGVVTALAISLAAVPTVASAADGTTNLAAAWNRIGPEEQPATGEDARKLYEQGERAYRRGRFREALEKFEKAYDLSEQPLLLYNIALAYRQLYDVADDVEELRRGRAVLKNFMLFADRDPDLDATDAKKLLTEIEALIEEHEKTHPEVVTTPDPGPDPGPGPTDPPPPKGKDPGRTLRIAGGAAMGGGGALVVGGTVAGIFFAIKGTEFSEEITRLRAEMPNACDEDDDSVECRQNAADIETARDNGRKANLGTGLAFALGGGLGVVAIATGVVLFLQGNKRTREWKASASKRPAMMVRPTFMPRGVGLTGRF